MNATRNGWTSRCAGWVLIAAVAVAVWTAGPQAAAQQRPSGSRRNVRVNTLIERSEQGGVVGPDVWQMIDMEHGPYLINELRDKLDEIAEQRKPNGQLQVTPGVRIPPYGEENPSWIVKQVLDIGALAIVFPQIVTKEEALRAVRSMRIPPQRGTQYPDPPGIRGAGLWSTDGFTGFPLWGEMDADEYMRRADLWPLNPDGELFAYIMIESPEGVRNINDILDVPGIGGILIGVNDLSINLGVGRATRTGQPLAPEAEMAVRTVLNACLAKKVLCSIIGGGDRDELIERGFFRMPAR